MDGRATHNHTQKRRHTKRHTKRKTKQNVVLAEDIDGYLGNTEDVDELVNFIESESSRKDSSKSGSKTTESNVGARSLPSYPSTDKRSNEEEYIENERKYYENKREFSENNESEPAKTVSEMAVGCGQWSENAKSILSGDRKPDTRPPTLMSSSTPGNLPKMITPISKQGTLHQTRGNSKAGRKKKSKGKVQHLREDDMHAKFSTDNAHVSSHYQSRKQNSGIGQDTVSRSDLSCATIAAEYSERSSRESKNSSNQEFALSLEEHNEELDLVALKKPFIINGNKYMQQGKFTVAIDCFTEALNLDPMDARCTAQRSLCYETMHQYDKALNDADETIKNDKKWPEGYVRKGKAYAGMKMYSAAAETLQQGLELEPTHSEALDELKKVNSQRLTEMGFERSQIRNALSENLNLDAALNSLLSPDASYQEICFDFDLSPYQHPDPDQRERDKLTQEGASGFGSENTRTETSTLNTSPQIKTNTRNYKKKDTKIPMTRSVSFQEEPYDITDSRSPTSDRNSESQTTNVTSVVRERNSDDDRVDNRESNSGQNETRSIGTAHLSPSQMLFYYKNKKLLAEGGFGDVYRCCETFEGTEVVVKVMSADASIYMSFVREKLMARVIHPFLMPIFAISEGHDTCCVMYPFMSKLDLRRILDADEALTYNLPYTDRVRILFQVATALHYLHTPVWPYRGQFMHCDVKSANVLLDGRLNSRLGDWGLCHENVNAKTHITRSRCQRTRGYLPTGADPLKYKTEYDIFSFAVGK